MKEAFRYIQFKGSSGVIIRRANQIIDAYRNDGYECLTLRQLYYQFVQLGWIQNKQSEYKRMGSIVNDARLGGLIDWGAIIDRTRGIKSVPHWGEPSEIIESAADSFRLDKWATQDTRIEVWVEKDALMGVIERACRKLDVSWFSCRGYTSQTGVYDASKRLQAHESNGQTPIIIHLGDHDPSGLDMTRDIFERIFMFMGHEVEVKRIALNKDQIDRYEPPPNPAKITDSRFEKYQEQHGDESWELDALDLRVIHELVESTVEEYRDEERFDIIAAEEKEKREFLAKASKNWLKIEKFLKKLKEPKPKK